MKFRVFVLDYGREKDSAQQLTAILGASPNPSFEVRQQRSGSLCNGGNWAAEVEKFAPVVNFLTFQDPIDKHAIRPVLASLRELKRRPPCILVAPATRCRQSELLRQGLADVWLSPLRDEEVLSRLDRWLAPLTHENIHGNKEHLGQSLIVGNSPSLLKEIQKIPKAAQHNVHVLIQGETGTGKELFAGAIHHASPRSQQPLLTLNCSTLPVELFENEMFGHASGAYTGANAVAPGLVEQAEGGTLFLDEVNSLPLAAQAKLLRFLDHKEFHPLGAQRCRKADLRIIAATNVRLAEAVAQRLFRSDLYYRLSLFRFNLPPLRERRTDILFLADHLLSDLSHAMGVPFSHLTDEAAAKLLRHTWPGNVRELRHVLAEALLLSQAGVIGVEELAGIETFCPATAVREITEGPTPAGSYRQLKQQTLREFDTRYFENLMAAHRNNVTEAAHAAGMRRQALQRHLTKLRATKGCSPQSSPETSDYEPPAKGQQLQHH